MRLESPGRRKNLESECGDRRSPQGLVRTLGIIESSLGGGGGGGFWDTDEHLGVISSLQPLSLDRIKVKSGQVTPASSNVGA